MWNDGEVVGCNAFIGHGFLDQSDKHRAVLGHKENALLALLQSAASKDPDH